MSFEICSGEDAVVTQWSWLDLANFEQLPHISVENQVKDDEDGEMNI